MMLSSIKSSYHNLLVKHGSLKRAYTRSAKNAETYANHNLLIQKPYLARVCEDSWALRAGGNVTKLGLKRFDALSKTVNPQELQLMRATYNVTPNFTHQTGWAELGNRLAANLCLLGLLLVVYLIFYQATRAYIETNLAVSLSLLILSGGFAWVGLKPSVDLLIKPLLLREKYSHLLISASEIQLHKAI